jgi:hypothetical protein
MKTYNLWARCGGFQYSYSQSTPDITTARWPGKKATVAAVLDTSASKKSAATIAALKAKLKSWVSGGMVYVNQLKAGNAR